MIHKLGGVTTEDMKEKANKLMETKSEENKSEENKSEENRSEENKSEENKSEVTKPEENEDMTEEELNQQNKKEKRKGFLKEIMIDAMIIMFCIIIMPRVMQRTIVSGSSMENSLISGDNLLVEKLSYRFSSPDRFDVVVFYPYGKEAGEYYVKRVIALPGETIQIIGDTIYVDGDVLEEDYGKDPITEQGIASEALTLGDDEYFLMGDNREVSFDSRYEAVGPIHKDLIVGKAMIRIWPFDSFGFFDK